MVHELEVAGTPEQMGLAHGEHLRGPIRDLAAIRIAVLMAGLTDVQAEEVRQWAERAWVRQAELMPSVHEEFEGIRRGAGLSVFEVVAVGAFTDLLRPPDNKSSPHDECTTLVSDRSQGNILFGTWDSHPEAAQALTVVRRSPINGPVVAGLTSAGAPIQQGVNEDGVAFAINNLTPYEHGDGLVYTTILTGISSAPSALSAASLVEGCVHASGHYYPIADATTALGVETSPGGVGTLVAKEHEALVHTNHYLVPEFRGRVSGGSLRRKQILDQLALSWNGDRSSVWEMLEAVEQSTSAESALTEDHTCATFIVDPVARKVSWRPGVAADPRPVFTIEV
jgi:isopenicillin-N N-acyltransferase-like protein